MTLEERARPNAKFVQLDFYFGNEYVRDEAPGKQYFDDIQSPCSIIKDIQFIDRWPDGPGWDCQSEPDEPEGPTQYGAPVLRPCESCHGAGYGLDSEACTWCKGTGKV